MIVDSHCHLDYFSETEIEEILARAAAAGVTRMVTIGTSVPQAAAVRALVERFPQVWGTVGVSVPVAMKSGLYATATSVANAHALRRVGTMPLVIHPIGTCGVLRGDLVLSAEDIALLARDDAKQALTLLSVALITDKEALAQ